MGLRQTHAGQRKLELMTWARTSMTVIAMHLSMYRDDY